MKKRYLLIPLFFLTALGYALPEVRITGATTVFLSIVKDNKDAVSQATQVNIIATGSTTGKGITAVQTGSADAAMTTDSLESLVANSNGAIKADELQEFPIKDSYLVFIVNKANPLTTITEDQVRDILTGTIRSWKVLGGADLPIAVCVEGKEAGNYSLLKKIVLKDKEITSRVTTVLNSRLIVPNVMEVPTAFGGTSINYVTDKVKVLEGYKITQHWCFITKKNPSPEVLKVMKEFIRLAK